MRNGDRSFNQLANAAHTLSGVNYAGDARRHNQDEYPYRITGPLTLAGELFQRGRAKFKIGFHSVGALADNDAFTQEKARGYLVGRKGRIGGPSFHAGRLSALAMRFFEDRSKSVS